ncbi:MAG: sigma-70 family RNA polymerase sigma factor [Verrucomicrobia bacterium]|jgi:DNA-directed RNA polymerase specialized sigma24 family protein|nr:sigma-70 family RNA polymerase sigma factor [Verrucomicrobiota bacterium]
MESWTQLEAFVRTGSDDAFEAVVSNHIDMVYATALRKTDKPDAASEITQATFILLAEKAGKLKQQGSLGAWLHRSALFKSMESR